MNPSLLPTPIFNKFFNTFPHTNAFANNLTTVNLNIYPNQ